MVINPDVVFCLFREAVGPFRKMSILVEKSYVKSCPALYILWVKQVSGSYYMKNTRYKNRKEPLGAQYNILRTGKAVWLTGSGERFDGDPHEGSRRFSTTPCCCSELLRCCGAIHIDEIYPNQMNK